MHIHGYPWRKFRNSEYEINEEIQIITIICPIARESGKPYTCRLLPDFLMPGCIIRLDKALEAYSATVDHLDIEHACSVMLCIDERTARKHLARIDSAIQQASLRLAGNIALQPELGELPKITPDSTPLTVLTRLLETESRARLRSGEITPTPGILSHIQKIMWEIFLDQPTACVMTNRNPP
jgi:hypothetical protein